MQGKKWIAGLLCGLGTLSVTSPAFSYMSVPMGWILEGNFGSSHIYNISYPGSTNRSGIAGNVNLGYKFMPYFAAELGYSRYANSSIKNQTTNTTAATVKNYSYYLAGKGILPLSAGFEFFAKLGVGRMNARVSIDNQAAANALAVQSSSHSATGLFMGVGAQYYFMPELAAVLQWQRQRGNSSTGSVDLYTAGLSFIFN